MSRAAALEDLKKQGYADRVIVFEANTATVALAAAALGVEPGRIAKTLAFLIADQPILILAEGASRIDNSKYKQTFGAKAQMIPPERVEALVGHAAGGVCPFGRRAGVPVYLDQSLRRYDVVYPAAGDNHTAVRLTVEELEAITAPEGWVNVTRLPEE